MSSGVGEACLNNSGMILVAGGCSSHNRECQIRYGDDFSAEEIRCVFEDI